jgi:hypothetical protein
MSLFPGHRRKGGFAPLAAARLTPQDIFWSKEGPILSKS